MFAFSEIEETLRNKSWLCQKPAEPASATSSGPNTRHAAVFVVLRSIPPRTRTQWSHWNDSNWCLEYGTLGTPQINGDSEDRTPMALGLTHFVDWRQWLLIPYKRSCTLSVACVIRDLSRQTFPNSIRIYQWLTSSDGENGWTSSKRKAHSKQTMKRGGTFYKGMDVFSLTKACFLIKGFIGFPYFSFNADVTTVQL